MAVRLRAGGVLDQPREERGLREIELPGGKAEVPLARRLDPVGAGAEVDGVQVVAEDPLLRVAGVDAQRDRGVPQLRPLVVVIAAQVDELRELLVDGARPLGERDVAEVVRKGPEDPQDVDPVVLVVALVLRRDGGLPHHRRDRVQAHRSRPDRAIEHSHPLRQVGDARGGEPGHGQGRQKRDDHEGNRGPKPGKMTPERAHRRRCRPRSDPKSVLRVTRPANDALTSSE